MLRNDKCPCDFNKSSPDVTCLGVLWGMLTYTYMTHLRVHNKSTVFSHIIYHIKFPYCFVFKHILFKHSVYSHVAYITEAKIWLIWILYCVCMFHDDMIDRFWCFLRDRKKSGGQRSLGFIFWEVRMSAVNFVVNWPVVLDICGP